MARSYAQIKVTIWGDGDFLDLTMAEQWLYMHIATNEGLSYAGVMDWRPKRIVPKASGLTLDEVLIAAQVLQEKRYLIVDEDTEEVLVRSFLRNDGLLKQRNMGGAVAKAYRDIGSRTLQAVIIHEMKRLHAENPDWKSWELLTLELGQRSIDPFEGIVDEPQNAFAHAPVQAHPDTSVRASVYPSDEPPF